MLPDLRLVSWLLLQLASVNLTHADPKTDGPYGRYALRVTGRTSISRPPSPPYPSCKDGGRLSAPNLTVVYASGQVTVNGDVWLFDGFDHDKNVVHDPHTAKDIRREIWFKRVGTAASGFLLVGGLNSDGDLICADGAVLAGSYSQ